MIYKENKNLMYFIYSPILLNLYVKIKFFFKISTIYIKILYNFYENLLKYKNFTLYYIFNKHIYFSSPNKFFLLTDLIKNFFVAIF